jgi:uncharacterized protein
MAFIDAAHVADYTAGPELDLDLVRDFLMDNPDFVRSDTELLSVIAAEPRGGNVISLGDLARERLLRETRSAQARFHEIVETARSNYESQMRVQEAILAILDATSPEDLAERMTSHVAFVLAADACIFVASESRATDQALDRIGSAVERLVPACTPVHMGPLDRPRTWLYGDHGAMLQSEALARLEFGPERRIGMLVLASHDIEAFRSDHGAELVQFFARVLERVLARFVESGQL